MSDKFREVYLDHAATTYLDPRVLKAMEPYWERSFGNPSSLYKIGREAQAALKQARQAIAHILHSDSNEIVFTGSGTESDNLAVLGVAKAMAGTDKRHIITSAIEHRAVLNACRSLESQGYEVTYLPVNQAGLVEAESLKHALRPDTFLVSIMYANNEIGTIQPIAELVNVCRGKNIYFHTDACQTAGALELDTKKLGVDLMTINASKIYGPKGVGLLYVKQGTPIQPIIYGGGQGKGLRSGTENIAGIVGFAKALELVEGNKGNENKRLSELRNFFINELVQRVPHIILNGSKEKRLPNNINVTIPGLDGEAFILLMDEAGIACSAGSACDAQSQDPSHVLLALGLSEDQAKSSIRFTLGARTSKTDLEYVLKQTQQAIERLLP